MTQTLSVRAQIKNLKVGMSADFPLERYDYVVNCRTRLQFGTELKYTSTIDREQNVVTITRIN